jgi:hypothetical protein
MTVWFDPQASWWPRRINEDRTDMDWDGTYEVLEFQTVMTGVGRGQLAFPKSCRYDGKTWSWTLDVIEVKVNQPLPAELFRPRVTAGIPVIDTRDGAAVQAFWHARAEEQLRPKWDQMAHELAARQPPAFPSDVTPQVNAAPDGGGFWSRMFLFLGVVLFVLAGGIVWRQRRASSP